MPGPFGFRGDVGDPEDPLNGERDLAEFNCGKQSAFVPVHKCRRFISSCRFIHHSLTAGSPVVFSCRVVALYWGAERVMDELRDTAIIVPTLGTRPDLLGMCIESIRASGCSIIHVVIPDPYLVQGLVDAGKVAKVVQDPGNGLAAAINAGIGSLPDSITYVNWLGDDDLLTHGSVHLVRQVLEDDSSVALAFGACDYVDDSGRVIFHSKSGRWAPWLMYAGPQMVPQPGSLFRVSDFKAVGGLDTGYKFAFDLDLMMKLHRVGRFCHLPHTLSNFRWHAGSLSVGGRGGSVAEASQIRVRNLPRFIRPFSILWEPVVRRAILAAGVRVTRRASLTSSGVDG